MPRTINAAVIGMFFAALVVYSASAIPVGDKAPDFKVTSGDNVVLSSGMLKGKTTALFYETKETKEKNRALKNYLNAFYEGMAPASRDRILRAAIIRCSQFFPTMWRRALRDNSKAEGLTIYGDWDGSMQKDFGMAPDESNFLIIDSSGVVRYQRSGIVPESEYAKIRDLLTK